MSGNPDGGVCLFCGKQISGSGSHPCNAKGGKKISFTEATTPLKPKKVPRKKSSPPETFASDILALNNKCKSSFAPSLGVKGKALLD